jgi:hypothetical protein
MSRRSSDAASTGTGATNRLDRQSCSTGHRDDAVRPEQVAREGHNRTLPSGGGHSRETEFEKVVTGLPETLNSLCCNDQCSFRAWPANKQRAAVEICIIETCPGGSRMPTLQCRPGNVFVWTFPPRTPPSDLPTLKTVSERPVAQPVEGSKPSRLLRVLR